MNMPTINVMVMYALRGQVMNMPTINVMVMYAYHTCVFMELQNKVTVHIKCEESNVSMKHDTMVSYCPTSLAKVSRCLIFINM